MKFLSASQLSDIKDEYEKFADVIKKVDPPNEPYKSKYQALTNLSNIQDKLDAFEECCHKTALLCCILTEKGVIHTETEEFTQGDELLTKSLQTCEEIADDRFTILSRLKALIYLGVIWCGREQYETARSYLEKALKVEEFFKEDNCQEVYTFKDLVNNPGDGYVVSDQVIQAEFLVTHAHFYLAQVYSKTGDSVLSADHCLITLSRQLTSPHLDWRDWSRNCAGLSEFYLNRENFTGARYCICSALSMIDKHKSEDKATETDDNVNNDNTGKTEAFVDRYCTKYGLTLLEYSICMQIEGKDLETSSSNEAIKEFENFDVNHQLNQVTDKRINNYAEAKSVFVWTQKHLHNAQQYFTLDERCSDYVELCRDMSQLYKHLATYAEDDDSKSKMHRRRVDLLEPLNRDLSPTYYLLTIRQILFELGEIFSDMVDIKRERWQKQPGNSHFAVKVNLLVKQSILYFETFLDTLRVEGKLPDKYTDETVRPAMLANFYIGRMHSKYVVLPNSHAELGNINQTYEHYKNIVDYCDKHSDALDKVSEEVSACREMVKLLPVKMEQIRRNMIVS